MKKSNSDRPKVDLPISKAEIVSHVFSIIMMAATFWLVWTYYPSLPNRIVTHFDLGGKVDGFGDKSCLLYLLTGEVVSYAMLTLIAQFPHTFNYVVPITEANAARQYHLAKKFLSILALELTGIMFFAIWSIIQSTQDQTAKMDVSNMITLVVLIFISCGFYMYRSTRKDAGFK
jgi:uncharacterized membrane protein